MNENIKLLLTKGEVEQLRSVENLTLRCQCMYSLHWYRSVENPTMSKLVLTHDRENEFRAALSVLKEFGLVSVGKYHVKVHAARVGPVERSSDDLGYDVLPEMQEYKKLFKLWNLQRVNDEKRIRSVQNIDGINFDDLMEFKIEAELVKSKIEELTELDQNDEEINKLGYHLIGIEQVLKNDIHVYNWRQYNEQRLYSTLTSLAKKMRKNVRSPRGYFFEVDIKASQPRLVKHCLTQMLENYDVWEYLARVKCEDAPDRSVISKDRVDEFEAWKIEVLKELDIFNELTVDDFYELVLGEYSGYTRDDIKGQFMYYFFDYKKKIKNGYFFNQYMYTRFPRINDFVRGLKNSQLNSTYRKNEFSISANLGKCEADLILKTICSRFVTENPNSSIFTIHDSINVNIEDLISLILIVEEEYKKLNINLSMKIKNLKTDKLIEYKEIENIKLELIEEEKRENKRDSKYHILSHVFEIGGIHDTKMDKNMEGPTVREILHRGKPHWMYKGRRTQQLLRSCKKYTKEQVIQEINDKFNRGEWK